MVNALFSPYYRLQLFTKVTLNFTFFLDSQIGILNLMNYEFHHFASSQLSHFNSKSKAIKKRVFKSSFPMIYQAPQLELI
jgi:hypothetical protein